MDRCAVRPLADRSAAASVEGAGVAAARSVRRSRLARHRPVSHEQRGAACIPVASLVVGVSRTQRADLRPRRRQAGRGTSSVSTRGTRLPSGWLACCSGCRTIPRRWTSRSAGWTSSIAAAGFATRVRALPLRTGRSAPSPRRRPGRSSTSSRSDTASTLPTASSAGSISTIRRGRCNWLRQSSTRTRWLSRSGSICLRPRRCSTSRNVRTSSRGRRLVSSVQASPTAGIRFSPDSPGPLLASTPRRR